MHFSWLLKARHRYQGLAILVYAFGSEMMRFRGHREQLLYKLCLSLSFQVFGYRIYTQ